MVDKYEGMVKILEEKERNLPGNENLVKKINKSSLTK